MIESRKGKTTTLVDSKRALKGGILLAAFKDFAMVREALLRADSNYLTLQRCEALLEIVPTETELEKIDAYTLEEGEKLAECERYFMTVRAVPRIQQRLSIIKMRHTFTVTMKDIRNSAKEYVEACEAIIKADKFRRVLEVALELGNTFNNQRAYGTKLSSLLEFLSMKAAGNSRITLLHYLCSVLKTKMPELYNFYEQLPCCMPQGKLPKPQNQIEIELRDVSGQIMIANHEITNNANEELPIEGVQDVFYSSMAAFCKEAGEDAASLKDEFNTMTETIWNTANYLGEPNIAMDKLFEMLSNFIASYMKAQQEHTRLIKDVELTNPGAE